MAAPYKNSFSTLSKHTRYTNLNLIVHQTPGFYLFKKYHPQSSRAKQGIELQLSLLLPSNPYYKSTVPTTEHTWQLRLCFRQGLVAGFAVLLYEVFHFIEDRIYIWFLSRLKLRAWDVACCHLREWMSNSCYILRDKMVKYKMFF